MQNTNSQYNRPAIGKQVADRANREGVEEHFPDPSVRKTIEVEGALSNHYDQLLGEVALSSTRTAKAPDVQTFARLPRVPDFVSSCPLVKCAKESAGKRRGTAGTKIGTVHVRWAFAAAAVLF